MDSIDGIKMTVKIGDISSADTGEVSAAAFTAQSVQGVVINEILADPSGSTANFDTDGDGSLETNDEFVELFNTSGVDVDISGWTLTDGGGDVFTFPAGTILPAGEHLVVVGGWDPGTPPSYVLVEGSNFGLLNGGDNITLSNADGTSSASASYGSDSTAGSEDFGTIGDGVSITRDPDGGMSFDNDTTPTPQCFFGRTRILTRKGLKKIRNIQVGDKVKTRNNGYKKVKWIGIQTIKVDQRIKYSRRTPVRFKKGRLGHNLPKRDLYTSSDHAMYVDGLLINAGALVNGVNIISTEPAEDFKYYHIELDSHELIIAEGCPTESYLPQNERRADYDNATEFNELYPDGNKLMLWPMPYARISSTFKVPASIENRIIERSKTDKLNRA